MPRPQQLYDHEEDTRYRAPDPIPIVTIVSAIAFAISLSAYVILNRDAPTQVSGTQTPATGLETTGSATPERSD